MNQSNLVPGKHPCEKCGSSDGKAFREDGSAHCFVCQANFKSTGDAPKPTPKEDFEEVETVEAIKSYQSFPLVSRGISQYIVDYFNVKMSVDDSGKPEAHFYPFTRNSKTVAYKRRGLPKSFSTVGDFKDLELFGQAQSMGTKSLVITEGELDAMAVAEAFHQKYGKIYPVVSLPNGVNSIKSILTNHEYISKFESVILMFDMDEVGQEAITQAAKMIGMGKVKIAKLQEKDPCDELNKQGVEALIRAYWDATTWSPAGILTGNQLWDSFQQRRNVESVPYPSCLEGLNEKLEGIRQGEITLFTSGTGSGKSTVIKEVILNLLETTEERVGLISLEESPGDTVEKLLGMQLQKSIHLATDEELRAGYEKVFGDERLVVLDHQGSVSDDSLLSKIEYMAKMGCKYLILDHITIAVSEGADGKTGNEAIDKVMSDLLKIVKRHDVWLGLISHLRKSQGASFEEGNMASIDDIKGSGSIKQISFDIIAFARNLVAEEEFERNKIELSVLKARFTGNTGPAGAATYNRNTGRLASLHTANSQGFEIAESTL